MPSNLRKLIFFLAFIEGGAVMCVELCSAKILSPFFGTSIYVWASVLGITLTALMSGYYLGGYLSAKKLKDEAVYWIMLISGCLVTFSPIISDYVLPITINLNLLLGTVISLMCFLFLPLTLFGSTSPLIINLLTDEDNGSGKSSGTVYAVSTLGGIITTFAVGFYTLPEFGITATLYGYGILVIVVSTALLLFTKTFQYSAAIGIVLALSTYFFQDRFDNEEVIYHSEGIMGDLKIVDREKHEVLSGKTSQYRELMINNISQSIMDKSEPDKSFFPYIDAITHNIQSFAKGRDTLLLGFGAGTLYKQLRKHDYNVDVVEIDDRIANVSKTYFHVEKDVNVVVDDARHFINTTDTKYDVVIYDLFNSETPPIHLLTKEAFGEIRRKLNPNGILVINYYGFITGDKGKAARSIYKTLLDEDYKIRLFSTPGPEKDRNLVFVSSQDKLKHKKLMIHRWIKKKNIDLDDALVLIDDKPILEHIYLDAVLAWRQDYNELNAKFFLQVN